MRKFLTVKPWILFVLIVLCAAWRSPSPLKEIINSISILTALLWSYAIGVYGEERIETLGLKPMNLKLFKFNVFFVIIYFFIVVFFFSNSQSEATNNIELKKIPLIISGFYFFFAIFQVIISVCKTIAKIELQREVSFGDYFTDLLLMIFFFIGVWILQPKVIRFFAANEEVLQ
jgi:hypothetical protein